MKVVLLLVALLSGHASAQQEDSAQAAPDEGKGTSPAPGDGGWSGSVKDDTGAVKDDTGAFLLDGVLSFDGREHHPLPNGLLPWLGDPGHMAGPFTLTLAVYLTSPPTGSYRGIIFKGAHNGHRTPSLWLHPDTNHVTFRVSTASKHERWGDSTGELPMFRWVHLALVSRGNGYLQLHVDGGLDRQVMLPEPPIANEGPLHVGRDTALLGVEGFVGRVRLYPRELGAAEVAAESVAAKAALPPLRSVERAMTPPEGLYGDADADGDLDDGTEDLDGGVGGGGEEGGGGAEGEGGVPLGAGGDGPRARGGVGSPPHSGSRCTARGCVDGAAGGEEGAPRAPPTALELGASPPDGAGGASRGGSCDAGDDTCSAPEGAARGGGARGGEQAAGGAAWGGEAAEGAEGAGGHPPREGAGDEASAPEGGVESGEGSSPTKGEAHGHEDESAVEDGTGKEAAGDEGGTDEQVAGEEGDTEEEEEEEEEGAGEEGGAEGGGAEEEEEEGEGETEEEAWLRRAGELYEKAMAADDGTGQGVAPQKALGLLLEAASMGLPVARARAAAMLAAGHGTGPKDPDPRTPLSADGTEEEGVGEEEGGEGGGEGEGEEEGGVDEEGQDAALSHWLLAAAKGNTEAQMALGYRHLFGHDMPQSCEAALFYYKRAATSAYDYYVKPGQQTRVEAIHLREDLARTRADHKGDEDDRTQFLMNSALMGDASSALALASRYYWGNNGLARDLPTALRYYEQAHNAGRLEGTIGLSKMYLKGEGVEKNLTTSLRYYEDAAARGSAEALNGLGYMYFHGDPTPENKTRALGYFQRSAELGSGDGLVNSGLMLRAGLGAPKDPVKAYGYLQRGVEIGHFSSIYNAALQDASGNGTPRNCILAVRRFKAVSEVGPWADPLKEALKLHLAGEPSKAIRIYDEAAELGYEPAAYNAAWLRDQHRMHALTPLPKAHARQAAHTAPRRYERLLALSASDTVAGWAHLRLGDVHYYGWGNVEGGANRTRAYGHYESAGNLGFSQGLMSVGYMELWGEGPKGEVNEAGAMARYKEAHAETDSAAVTQLGLWYVRGVVLARRAREWLAGRGLAAE